MRKFILVVAASVAALAGAAGGSAATATVTITKAGFVPAAVTIKVGDSVTWTNTDTVVHQVAVDKFACNLTIQPAQSGSCTFTKAGTYKYSDPTQKGKSFAGTVDVQAPSTLTTIAASRTTVVFGQNVTFTGQLSSRQAGENVDLWAQPSGQNAFTKVATVASTDNGNWTITTKPTIGTVYQVRVRNATSQSVTISVKPKVTLGYSSVTKRFTTKVTAAQSFAGKIVSFQRKSSLGQWVTVKKLKLNAGGAASFRATLPKGRNPVRVLLPASQTLPGYLSGMSPIRYVTR